MVTFLSVAGLGILLVLIQVLAALPWLLSAIGMELVKGLASAGKGAAARLLGIIIVGSIAAPGTIGGLLLELGSDAEVLHTCGRVYGAVLHLQLCLDVVVLPLMLLLLVWPKGGAVALAAFREGIRQPMFWLVGGFFLALMLLSPVIPYFTFGEDFVMVKQLGYDMIMLAALIFGVLAASMSITEEIEGRTAITLMSKPVSRRQFLIGKYLGILFASLGMTTFLSWVFNWVLAYKRADPIDKVNPPPLPVSWIEFLESFAPTPESSDFLRGIFQWTVETGDVLPGVVLGFCQVMVLLAIATALATRLPLVINLVACLVVYFMGHLTPVLVQIAKRRQATDPSDSAVSQLLTFMAQVFDTLAPSLDLFRVESALLSDVPPPIDQFFFHVGQAFVLAVMYTAIGLLLGLVLFEDRDLA